MSLTNEFGEPTGAGIASIFIGLIIAIIGIIGLFSMFETVDTGYRGVVTNLSKVTGEVKDEGFYTLNPFTQDVIEMNVQLQKSEVEASAASKDLQNVSAKIAINFHLDPTKVDIIYQEMRQDYVERLIAPAIQESIKSATAKYTAEELITKRAEVREAIAVNLKEKVEYRGILVDEVNLINFNFSESFNNAIEAKVKAEQDALASRNTLEKIKYDAQQNVERARGEGEARVLAAKAEAEAIKIQAEAIQSQGGADYVKLKAIEQWNGDVPTTMVPGSTVPFINLNQ